MEDGQEQRHPTQPLSGGRPQGRRVPDPWESTKIVAVGLLPVGTARARPSGSQAVCVA